MANQHQDPNRPRPAEDRAQDRVRSQQLAAGKRSGHAGPSDPAGTPGTKGDPPPRRPGEYPDTTPDVIAGNQPGRANAKSPGGPGSQDKRRPSDSSRSRNQDPRRSGGPDRWSGDESHPNSGDDEPIDRR